MIVLDLVLNQAHLQSFAVNVMVLVKSECNKVFFQFNSPAMHAGVKVELLRIIVVHAEGLELSKKQNLYATAKKKRYYAVVATS